MRFIFERLRTTIIECLHWSECIDRYDDERTVLYIDLREEADYVGIAERVRHANAKWLLITYYQPELRELLRPFFAVPVPFTDMSYAENERHDRQVIFTSFDPVTYQVR